MNKKLLGAEIKKLRLEKRLSQKECCAGICSQPLLSHIESGDYMPAADILLGLLARLGISAADLTLQSYFPMSPNKSMNAFCETLCRAHDYEKLRDFLLDDATIDAVTEAEQTGYFYYLAVAEAQTGDATAASQNFQLARAETDKLTLISRLSDAALGVLAARKGQKNATVAVFTRAFERLDAAHYDENLNSLYYLKAYSAHLLHDDLSALTTLETGIRFISEHDSHYMLANFYYLAAQLATEKSDFLRHSALFSSLYHEKIYKV
ncbi:MAG: helix-turn-helix domain-containing protein [Streptococcaceae bacterium]|nr:helix-turn-helix domain-containing protein [Streptococcaceae bacterium]